MLKDHFVVLTGKNLSLIKNLSINNKLDDISLFNTVIMELNIGENVQSCFIDDDILLIESNDCEIRIDISIASMERSIEKFRSETHVDTK